MGMGIMESSIIMSCHLGLISQFTETFFVMELKDWLNSINFNKENLIKENPDIVKQYPPFIINKCMSGHMDTIMYANEMNKHHFLDKDMQYSFYLNIVRKRKRFSPWIRKDKNSDLEFVKQYYGYSTEKASQIMKILSNEQIEFIKKRLDKGGKQ